MRPSAVAPAVDDRRQSASSSPTCAAAPEAAVSEATAKRIVAGAHPWTDAQRRRCHVNREVALFLRRSLTPETANPAVVKLLQAALARQREIEGSGSPSVMDAALDEARWVKLQMAGWSVMLIDFETVAVRE